MGEEAKQEAGAPKEEVKAATEEKKEEKTEEKAAAEEKKEEAPPAEEKKEEEPKPPSPFVLYVDLHCMGCAKKIERSILKIRGVEGVVIDMGTNQLSIKGVVEPQAVCNTIEKKTKRRAKVLSPLPAAEGEPIPQVVASQVSGLTTVELNVNMHCAACAEQLKRKILKMKGVRTAETELSSGKVTVTGTMDANKLVDYVYRRTKKQAKVVPQPEPEEPKPEDKPAPAEEAQEKKEEAPAAEGGGGEKPPEEEKKEGSGGDADAKPAEQGLGVENKEEASKQQDGVVETMMMSDEQRMQKMMMYSNYYQPLYFIERIPPPQLFSDENPNACCIT
ncbi:hypothetical protein M9H77_26282 [Catharanthus roseus]|uniref:Uncharacterized protein n=1 Tax=Catharanthus roseus TaxID=4058 RepID=A0ACC0A9J5_CATRO|nr:hypothetical protein M9H77_26282 [Catharanthus roseus]